MVIIHPIVQSAEAADLLIALQGIDDWEFELNRGQTVKIFGYVGW